MDLSLLFGVSASVFTGISLIPQLVKIVREKKAQDVSLLMLFTLLTGLGLWVTYGFFIEDWIIIISNAFSFLINVTIIFLSVKYKAMH